MESSRVVVWSRWSALDATDSHAHVTVCARKPQQALLLLRAGTARASAPNRPAILPSSLLLPPPRPPSFSFDGHCIQSKPQQQPQQQQQQAAAASSPRLRTPALITPFEICRICIHNGCPIKSCPQAAALLFTGWSVRRSTTAKRACFCAWLKKHRGFNLPFSAFFCNASRQVERVVLCCCADVSVQTPCLWAAYTSNIEIIEVLMQRGAVPARERGFDGVS